MNRLFFLSLLLCLVHGTSRADEASAVEAFKKAGFAMKMNDGGHVVEIGVAAQVSMEKNSGLKPVEWTPELLQRLSECPELARLHVIARQAGIQELEVFTKVPKLEALRLEKVNFDDTGFATLAKCEKMQILFITENDAVTGAGVSALRPLGGLKVLGFADCRKFSADGVRACAQLTQLEYLGFHHLDLGDDEMALLEPLAGSLKEFEVASDFNGKMSESGLAHLTKLKNLESLSFREAIIPFAKTLKHLQALPKLKMVNLDDVDTDNAEAMKLVAALPNSKFKGTAASDEQVQLYNERREAYLKSR